MRTGYVAGPWEFTRDAKGQIIGRRRDVMEYSTLGDRLISQDLGIDEAEESEGWEFYDLICDRKDRI